MYRLGHGLQPPYALRYMGGVNQGNAQWGRGRGAYHTTAVPRGAASARAIHFDMRVMTR
jgi:hypothetical protein